MKIINKSTGNIIADKIKVANNPITRFIGLLNRSGLAKGEGLLIIPCKSIHSFGMKFKFDAVFLDKKNKAKYLIKSMKTGKVSPIIWSAHSVLELPEGTINSTSINLEDTLELLSE